ncbi:DUF2567 domain-containing protein [Actinophytocola sp.]|uniref:DUF2567 domain-containing protein n=1 Tax=Actinophytocola sp. TaxID=1872138 RepID=UPI003D6ABD82
MAEQPVGAQGAAPNRAEHAAGNGSGRPGAVAPTEYPAYFPVPWEPERPKVVVKADLLPALSVLSTVSLLGLAVGWLWSRLAPPQRMVIAQDGAALPLTAESYHRFDGLILFTLLGLAAGFVTGLAVWFLRERRGPVIMIAATIGSTVGGWLAMQVGTAWAEGRYPVSEDVQVLDVVLQAPRLESAWILLAWPLITALVYGLMAAWNSMDDLGRRLG